MKAAHEVSDGLTSDAARIFDPPSQGFRTMRVYVLATCLLFKLLCVTVIHRNMWAFFFQTAPYGIDKMHWLNQNFHRKILKQVEYESARRKRHINEKTRIRDEEGSTFFLCTFIKGTQANLKELSDMCFL